MQACDVTAEPIQEISAALFAVSWNRPEPKFDE